jgi:hypothetical protein
MMREEQGELKFEGYHYRTSARFGSRIDISIHNGSISITGPRVGVGIYKIWISVQILLLFLMIPAIILPIIFGQPIYLLMILALLFLHYAISGTGAIILWEGANVASFINNRKGETKTFRIADIKDMRIGKGWERKGLWFVIPYVIPIINKMSAGLCVSFEAPDMVTGKDVVYAFLLHSQEEAKKLVALLK